MLRLKPYNINEADIILSWSKDKIAFYKWSAGILGEYPIRKEKFAFEIYGAKKVSLSVFENNESAYFCYKSVGFDDVILDKTEIYYVLGEEWKCKELMIETQ